MSQSDQTATIAEIKRQVQDFCEARSWDQFHGAKDLAIGLVTESCELLEIFRFMSEEQTRQLLEAPKDRERIADELADSLYFIVRFAQLYNFDLATCIREKMIKNAVKYPVE